MELYLMQHGVAEAEAQDPARPLTDPGRAAVERVTARARAAGVHGDACVHSGKLRAEQTAHVLAEDLPVPDVETRADLGPTSPVPPFAEWLAGQDADLSLAVVAHLPFLDRLTSLLVAGEESAQVVRFHNAGLVKLVPKDDVPGFAIDWVLTPDLAS
jgi:phosphohistidine phosphatase